MKYRTGMVISSLMAGMFLTASSSAQSSIDAARSWGLLGSWSSDCSKLPGIPHFWVHYVVLVDQLYLIADFGPKNDLQINLITSASVAPDGKLVLSLIVKIPGIAQHRRESTAVKDPSGTRYRGWESRGLDTGVFSIRNGKVLAHGIDTDWMHRCS